MVGQLHASGVHNTLDLVRDYEFQVLSAILVTDEEPVLDLNHPDQVVFIHLLHGWWLLLLVDLKI